MPASIPKNPSSGYSFAEPVLNGKVSSAQWKKYLQIYMLK